MASLAVPVNSFAFLSGDCYNGSSNHGALAMPAITKRTVDEAAPGTRAGKAVDAFLWDDKLKGFGLKVTPAGAKVYLCQYRTGGRGTPTKRVTIGRHGSPWTPDQARRKAMAIIGAVAEGKDPAAEKAAKRKSEAEPETFAIMAERFLAHGRTKRGGRELRQATKDEYRRALLDYAADLAGRPLRSIRRRDIAGLIDTVAAERGTTSAMRTRAALSRFFGWAMARDDEITNPVAGTEGYATARRQRVLSDDELRAIWQATAAPIDFNLIVRLCLWTGARRSEPGDMAGSELQGALWTVPGSRTKNHRPLALPLPRQAVAALDAWPRIEGRDKLFGRQGAPGKPDTGFQGWSRAKERLDAKLGFAEPWDLHDLRRSVETRMAALGVRKEIVNRTLNHAMGPITETYDHHDYLAEKAAALQTWADALDAIVSEPAHGNVVRLVGRR
jgi:integrase